ncbi:MAG: hypothetical protein ACRDVM_00785 [Acidimicrobiia bacterium]
MGSRRKRDAPVVPQATYDAERRRRETAEVEVRKLRRELRTYQGGPSYLSDLERANVQSYIAVVGQLSEAGDPRRARSVETGETRVITSEQEGFDEGRGPSRHARGARRRLNGRVAEAIEEASVCALGECSHPPSRRCWARACPHYSRTVPAYALVCPVGGHPVGGAELPEGAQAPRKDTGAVPESNRTAPGPQEAAQGPMRRPPAQQPEARPASPAPPPGVLVPPEHALAVADALEAVAERYRQGGGLVARWAERLIEELREAAGPDGAKETA